MAKDTDRALVRRFKRGDASAFDLLFLRYRHKVLSLIGRRIGNPEDVQDVAQEAFIKAFRALPRFRGDSAFYTWLYRIADNTAKNHIAAKSRRPQAVDIDVGDPQIMDSVPSLRDEADPASALARDELSDEIEQALAALPDDLRTAVTLRELDGLSYQQIASIMQCPIGTVRSRIFRARQAIDERIGQYLHPQP